jgi:rRNA maturation protein Nop10
MVVMQTARAWPVDVATMPKACRRLRCAQYVPGAVCVLMTLSVVQPPCGERCLMRAVGPRFGPHARHGKRSIADVLPGVLL